MMLWCSWADGFIVFFSNPITAYLSFPSFHLSMNLVFFNLIHNAFSLAALLLIHTCSVCIVMKWIFLTKSSLELFLFFLGWLLDESGTKDSSIIAEDANNCMSTDDILSMFFQNNHCWLDPLMMLAFTMMNLWVGLLCFLRMRWQILEKILQRVHSNEKNLIGSHGLQDQSVEINKFTTFFHSREDSVRPWNFWTFSFINLFQSWKWTVCSLFNEYWCNWSNLQC